jgi:hypothetical protein
MTTLSGGDLFGTTGAVVGGTASAVYGVGKVVFEIGKVLGDFASETAEDSRRESRAKALAKKLRASDAPLVAPFLGPDGKTLKFKLLGILDVVPNGRDGYNAIVLQSLSQRGQAEQTFHLEPISTLMDALTSPAIYHYLEKDSSCFGLRVHFENGTVATCYAFISQIGVPSTILCGDTTHALLVYALWPDAEFAYKTSVRSQVNIPQICGLSSTLEPQELEIHGLCLARKGDPNFGMLPVMQSCWDCVRAQPRRDWRHGWRRGVHPATGTRWCLHTKDPTLLPAQIVEPLVGAFAGRISVSFTTEKSNIDKKNKTYQLVTSFCGPIAVQPDPPAQQNNSKFTIDVITEAPSTENANFMSRGAHPKSPHTARWELLVRGEPCPHASVSLPTVVEKDAPQGTAFVATTSDIPNIHAHGLIPIASVSGMTPLKQAALSLSIADQGQWVYWKDPNQCLGCAQTMVRGRLRVGSAVIFA